MNKIICSPENLLPQQFEENIIYFSTYSNSHRENAGYFGSTLRKDIEKDGLSPSVPIWDFTTIALSVAAADNSISRKLSADGWTRQIELTIHLCDPSPWENVKQELERIFKFLTGDFWSLIFKEGGVVPPVAKNEKKHGCDCISLLSGGVDSLVGAIDLVSEGNKPIFVSQIVKGDAEAQKHFAQTIMGNSPHFQWSHKIHSPKGKSEGSTRGRSIVFFAFATLASSCIKLNNKKKAKIYVPENGFISLNIALNAGRIGSFSTKTTHPVFLNGLQSIWDKLNLNIQLVMPYQFKTKGDMILECKNKNTLLTLISSSTSCGKYLRYGHQHCGRCVPCMVRRAAFLKAGIPDATTKGYKFSNLSIAGRSSGPNDVGAMAIACLNYSQFGVQSLILGSLGFTEHSDRSKYEDVISRGFDEIANLLKVDGVI